MSRNSVWKVIRNGISSGESSAPLVNENLQSVDIPRLKCPAVSSYTLRIYTGHPCSSSATRRPDPLTIDELKSALVAQVPPFEEETGIQNYIALIGNLPRWCRSKK
ncbi:hypothetical protein TNCV_1992091 [Trichonephila clavipes]|nr:hypothetical protein TNCV_1992091 [Trichonephila clavipes]